MRGLTKMPLSESPLPMRCACASHTFFGSSPSQAARTSSWLTSRAGSAARQGLQNPCSGQYRHAASARPPVRAAPAPNRRVLLLRETSGGPVLDVALQHLVLEVLLLQHRLGDVA